MISYHSVSGNSFFFQQFCPTKGWKGVTLTMSLDNLSQKSCFFSRGKNFGYFILACNFGNFGNFRACLAMFRNFGHHND